MKEVRNSGVLRTIPLLITICILSFPAYAKYSGGTGEPDDPYQIATAEDLLLLGESPEDYDKHFILTADIDLDPNLPDGKVFDKAVIAPDTDPDDRWSGIPLTFFIGTFNGNAHKISHLTIKGGKRVGLFGRLLGEVKDLGVVNVNITGSGEIGGLVGYNLNGTLTDCYSTGAVNGNSYVGGLVGYNDYYGAATQCYSTASVTGTSYYGHYVGGLVGYNRPDGTVTQCYSTGSVSGNGSVGGLMGRNEGAVTHCYSTGTVSGTDWTVGGLVGDNYGDVTQCYSTGKVDGNVCIGGLLGENYGDVTHCCSTSSVSGKEQVGGLVGSNRDGTVTQCYSTGSVNGNLYVGGLVGYNSHGDVTHCYSTGAVSGNSDAGGLVGANFGSVLYSIWDIETSGLSKSAGGLGLTTSEMLDPYMLGLNGFANDPNWVLNAGHDYPRLAWEGTPGDIIPEPRIEGMEGGGTAEAPYRIDTAQQLILIGKASILWDKHFVLGADVDLDPNLPDVTVFGQAVIPTFMGVFDGSSHTISYLTIMGESYLGLFGYLESGAEVKDLGLVDVNVTGLGDYIGGLVGANGGGTVTRCYSTGTIKGEWAVGGLVGWNDGSVTQCYSTGAVSGGSDVGGLVGTSGGEITNCYSTGTVSGNISVGGLVGANHWVILRIGGYRFNPGLVARCYSTGAVSGTESVGGLVGLGPATASFWDTQTSKHTWRWGSGTGKTTAEMQTARTFLEAGWDFIEETANGTEDIWWILEGQDYPRLWWELVEE